MTAIEAKIIDDASALVWDAIGGFGADNFGPLGDPTHSLQVSEVLVIALRNSIVAWHKEQADTLMLFRKEKP